MASNVVLLLRNVLTRRAGTLRSCLDNSLVRGIHHQGIGVQPCLRIATQLQFPSICGVQMTRNMGKDVKRKHDVKSDSDSDSSESDKGDKKGKHKARGNTEFWRLKMRTLHAIYDINKDGVVSWEDFQIMGDRFIKLGHLSPPQQEEFRNTLKSVWEEQWGPADPYNMVNAYQYLENMHHVLNDKNLKRKAHRFLPYLFRAVDKDKSGEISVEEFKLFFKCLGLSEEDAVASFRVIDINNDNLLSEKEFVKYGRQFFMTENEKKPSRVFWGPLLNH